ncbi:MAG: MarR family winged helix-turn-helix transcriptional regulator [Propionibacteriaceae bacterium]
MPTDRTSSIPERREPALGVLLFLPYRHLEQEVLAAVRAAGHPITLAQARIFQRVDHTGSRLTTLAASSQVSKQTAGVLVDELVRGGYVTRVPDPTDGRARLIMITDRGHAVITVATARQREIEDQWRAHLGPRATGQLQRALTRLREITDPYR